jgi:hypothetical protein
MCQGRNIAFKISTFIPFSFMPSAKNKGLIPEPFMKISSSSWDFHKNGVPNPAGENVTGGLKPTGLPIVIKIRIQRESFAEKFKDYYPKNQ